MSVNVAAQASIGNCLKKQTKPIWTDISPGKSTLSVKSAGHLFTTKTVSCCRTVFTLILHCILSCLALSLGHYLLKSPYVTSYPYNSSILSEFNPTSGRLHSAFTPNQVQEQQGCAACGGGRVCGDITGHCVTLSCLLRCVALVPHYQTRDWKPQYNMDRGSTSRLCDRGIEWETRLVWTQPYLVHCIEKMSRSRQVM